VKGTEVSAMERTTVDRPWLFFALIAVVLLMGALYKYLPSRASPCGTRGASNLSQIGKACWMYSDVPTNGGAFPADPLVLHPAYIKDDKTFGNPRPGQPWAGYTYVAGLTPNDADAILMFQNAPTPATDQLVYVLSAGGAVEARSVAELNKSLAAMQQDFAKSGRTVLLVQVNPIAPGKPAK
jgi:hypothetical protein